MACFSSVVLFCGCTNTQALPEKKQYLSFDGAVQPEAAADSVRSRSFGVQNKAVAASGNSYFAKSDRMMAYTAGFTLTVKKRNTALDEVKKLAESLGGYLVSSARGNMKLKIPVAKADEFLKMSGEYGKMSDFRISSEDLTDTITDLGVRLDNLRKLRKRLTELLTKAKNVDEMLKVERELNRITTEIERIDAQLQNNKNRVAFVTFDVAIIEEHGAIPDGTPQAFDRFSFLQKLASNNAGMDDEPLFGLNTPEGFVEIGTGARESGFAATSSDDCIFRTWEADAAANSTLEFWEKVICRALQSRQSFEQLKSFPAEFRGQPAVKITAKVNTARGLQLYMAVISLDKCLIGDSKLQIVEFFGPEEAFRKHEKMVIAALQK